MLNKRESALTLILDLISELVSELNNIKMLSKIFDSSDEDLYEVEESAERQIEIFISILREKVSIPKARKKETIDRLKRIRTRCPSAHPARNYWLELSKLINFLEKSLRK